MKSNATTTTRSASRGSRRARKGQNCKLGETKRTPELEAAILDGLRARPSFTMAADLAGIHRDTLLSWRRKDPEFAQACRTAHSRGLIAILDQMLADDSPGWTKYKILLERLGRDIFGKAAQGDELGAGETPARIVFEVIQGGRVTHTHEAAAESAA